MKGILSLLVLAAFAITAIQGFIVDDYVTRNTGVLGNQRYDVLLTVGRQGLADESKGKAIAFTPNAKFQFVTLRDKLELNGMTTMFYLKVIDTQGREQKVKLEVFKLWNNKIVYLDKYSINTW